MLINKFDSAITIVIFVCFTSSFTRVFSQYEPDWKSLDSRVLPRWYDEAKIGIFIHWGMFSVPSYGSEWFWKEWKDGEEGYVNFMLKQYRPGFTYQDFSPGFRGEFFDPTKWANLFNDAGARYVVLTSKHHEGFTMWPSKYSWGWNSVDVGPGRDLCGALSAAVRETAPHIRFGLYHSLIEWYNPILKEDKENFFSTNLFASTKTMPELYELVNAYKPEIIWSDGDWIGTPEYWESKEFLAWLFNESPVKDSVVVNDRWGIGTSCTHGSFFTCSDNYNPDKVKPYKWETCLSLDKMSWGYRRNSVVADYLNQTELVQRLVKTISLGGNFLVNVGPTSDGTIPLIMQERLLQMGEWLKINGEAVYESRPWIYQNDSIANNVWYTEKSVGKDTSVYCMVLYWPNTRELVLGRMRPNVKTSVHMLGHKGKLRFSKSEVNGTKVIKIKFPQKEDVDSSIVWTLKLQNMDVN